MDELRELDLHLDDFAEHQQQACWRSYQRWTVVWVVMLIITSAVLPILLVLVLVKAPMWAMAGAGGFGVTSAGWFALATVLGYRARRDWNRFYRLRHDEGL